MKILTHRSCVKSAKLLRDRISALTGRRIRVTRNPARIRGPFVRYGSAETVNVPDTTYNSQDFIKLVSDKGQFSTLVNQHGVYSPVYRKDQPTAYPVIIRKTLNASGGRGIVVCPDAATFAAHWSPAYVWTPFIKTRFELRVHVIGGKIVKVMKKRFVGLNKTEAAAEQSDELTEPALPIRNLDRGYHYSNRRLEKYPKLDEVVAKLNPLLKGRFYTLDVGWDKARKEYLIFEANSGSGLNTQTVELYADYLAREMLAR